MSGLRADLYRYTASGGFRAFLRTWFREPSFRVLFWFRLASRPGPFRVAAWFLLRRAQIRYGIELPARTAVGPGLYVGHYGAVTVSSRARIGSNCNLSKGVTIGAVAEGKNAGAPCIGDRVWIGIGAMVVGNVTVGDGAAVAPMSLVNRDVPAGMLVAGNPAEVVRPANPGYILNPVG